MPIAARRSSKPTRRACAVWFPDPETGKKKLLFRIAAAKEAWQSFDGSELTGHRTVVFESLALDGD